MRMFLYLGCVYLCAALITLPVAGCGSTSRVDQVPVIPVTGKVVFQGQTTPGALIVRVAEGSDQAHTLEIK